MVTITNTRVSGIEKIPVNKNNAHVFCKVKAPIGWWYDFLACKVGSIEDSDDLKETIKKKEFDVTDFTEEFRMVRAKNLSSTIGFLNSCRSKYLKTKDDKWLISIFYALPMSYNRTRLLAISYKDLDRMYGRFSKTNSKEWKEVCAWIERLPYFEASSECV